MTRARVLVADDESSTRRLYRTILGTMGVDVVEAADGAAAITALEQGPFELILTDLSMPRADGLAVLRASGACQPGVPVILITGAGRITDAVAAMKAGAADFIQKPFSEHELRDIIAANLPTGSERGRRSAGRAPATLIGESKLMRDLMVQVERIGQSNATVLVTGETGTGKEVIARLLHGASRRAGHPLVVVNCGAIPDGLVESELFGHAKGSFTGATERQVGRFVQADSGTLFLDEVGELPLPAQAKLLRALQEHEVFPVGDPTPVMVDIRVIAATNRDLEALVREGKFREDLLYRLAVVPIEVPPLRARPDDIAPLVRWFLDRANARNHRAVTLEDAVIGVLERYPFPGNVRELGNLVERLVVTHGDGVVTVADLPPRVRGGASTSPPAAGAADVPLDQAVQELEDRMIDQALARADGNKARAAELLGMNRTTLVQKLRRRPRPVE